jgi:transcription initiation factor TFIIB
MDDFDDKYLNFTDEQIDNLLLGVDLNKVEKKENSENCISCKSENLIIDNSKGYLVCQDCAVINKEFSDKNVDYIDEQSGSSRYGCPSSYFFPNSALGTKIHSKGYNRIALLQKHNQMPYKERSLMDVLDIIQTKCKKYSITQTIIDTAKIIYKKVSDYKHTKGKRVGKNMIIRCINRRSMIAACLFYACKTQKEPRCPKEIADIYDLEVKHVIRGCKKILECVDIVKIIDTIEPVDFIERFSKKLNLDKKYIIQAKDIAMNITKLNLATKHEPPSVAACCILLMIQVNNINVEKKQLSNIFNISEVTINKTFKDIKNVEQIILDNKMTNTILVIKNNS